MRPTLILRLMSGLMLFFSAVSSPSSFVCAQEQAQNKPASDSTATSGRNTADSKSDPAKEDGATGTSRNENEAKDRSSPAKPTSAARQKADQQLLKDLVPDLPLPSEEKDSLKDGAAEAAGTPGGNAPDELDHAVQSMREASKRLSQKDVTPETRKRQTDALADIDRLIEKLKHPPQSNSQSSQDQQNQDRNQSSRNRQQQKQSAQQQQKQQQSEGGQSETSRSQPTQGKAEESQEKNDRDVVEHATALARRKAMLNEIWGHLPPTMRERLMNASSEKLLPQYEDLIRRYYEALAESTTENGTGNRPAPFRN